VAPPEPKIVVTDAPRKPPRLRPPWLIRLIWAVHRAALRLTRGRLGLWRPRGEQWGTLRLETVGRRSGKRRVAILGYYEDGPNLVTLAMNGWMPGEPGWWLNLQEHPQVRIELANGPRLVRARAAQGEERARLWEFFRGEGDGLEALAAKRGSETAVVILEPVTDA
jgi:deazaflavin-dependent oxidoreductase (nitroreductase family)